MRETSAIDTTAVPSSTGCVECEASEGWWFHLRRCATCGHIGCCDDSLGRHATAHATASGHVVIRSFEPGESWFYSYATSETFEGPELAPPESHPVAQSTPGPAERVPQDWQGRLLEQR
ncbi:UBP-type zinc finger domain-containing protein [Lacisediminihabitans sp. H27-G8]|uniref:UBP-type zinc finger domain-containing protein n=1 Tax=Lacisediminihabitans sp. H27-G8 TaxID=3111909 RepID=UPI0038FC53B8